MQLTDVLIHINDNVSETGKENLVEELRNLEGVIAPRFSKDKKHLLLVAYNPDTMCSLTLLREIKSNGYKAQLIGM